MSEPSLNVLLDDLEDQGKIDNPTSLYEAFGKWAKAGGRPLYPHQDESALEIFSGNHVIASTPTGSGKSIIALAAHFKALAAGERSYYTAPLKALVSEKFFDLVKLFGSANVGMITGDVKLNADAPIICCTAEILANQALREGSHTDVSVVVMDEFHFYSEPDRGWAWQIPLLRLPQAQMILLSATLGDVSFFVEDMEKRSGRKVAVISDAPRPVPLEMEYTLEATHELLERLVGQKRYPVYLVHFSQKEALASAKALLSANLLSRQARAEIARELGDFRFNTTFGKTLSKFLRQGIGIHHAGMLPRFRRLVERLAQKGVLAVVCGTDTLGVGINVPIRTVVLTSLAKFDGTRQRHLNAREFHQIAGRAGRAGFDDIGYVEVQAPEHVIENRKAVEKAGDDPKKLKKLTRKAAPEGRVNWTESTFERLRSSSPEPLTSQLRFTPSMVLAVLESSSNPIDDLLNLACDNHDPNRESNPHLRQLGHIYQALLTAEVITVTECGKVQVNTQLPDDFALNQALSPFALAAMDLLNPQAEDYALDCVSIIEAILEDPRPLLIAQEKAQKGIAINAMKAQGMEYEERMQALESITWPKPLEELLEPAFAMFAAANPWIDDAQLSPKSVVREMIENAMTFSDLVSRYEIAPAEGVILRYLTDAYRALHQVIPPSARNEELDLIISWLGNLVRTVDSSLLDEWESMGLEEDGDNQTENDQIPAVELAFGADEDGKVCFSANLHSARTKIKNAVFQVVELIAADNLRGLVGLNLSGWDENRFDEVLERIWSEFEYISIDAQARSAEMVILNEKPEFEDLLKIPEIDPTQFELTGRKILLEQRLMDSEEAFDWSAWFLIDLDKCDEADEVVLNLLSIAPR
ncbi:DUF3516 domain-containing protein [Actinomycetaceae bacterium TAE3-ERU4]|nr:DUF3516 domain-containing protein [Actinomycetaceae bacterium TAE3-ERU4]